MEGIYLEFENENSLRSYPFAAGCVHVEDEESSIPAGIFVDAALYPINPSGVLYLSSISQDGVFSISDSNGIVMSGTASGNTVELFDTSEFSRHVGTLVASSEQSLSEFAGRGVLREYSQSDTEFAASCVFPVVIDGVTAVGVGDSELATGKMAFSNAADDDIRVSSGTLEDGRKTLRFDVLPKLVIPDERYIRRIICVVDGQTPFRIDRLYDPMQPAQDRGLYNTVILKLDGIDKDTVCSSRHRENSFEMADSCGCDGPCRPDIPSRDPIPYTYQLIEVFIPPDELQQGSSLGPEGGISEGADNAFYLVVPNLLGYGNPLSITLEDGVVSPKTSNPDIVIEGKTAELAEGAMLDDVTSKGIVLQVPGLSGE